jgi:hypothetical protein
MLIKKFEEFIDFCKTGGTISENDAGFLDTLNQTETKIQEVKKFLQSLP